MRYNSPLVRKFFTRQKKKIFKFFDKRPFASFFIFLGVFFILIVISNILGAPKQEEKKEAPEVKKVRVYNIGSAPKMTVQAQVEKSGVVTISALSPGVVSEIPVSPGDVVNRGTVLVSTATNYQGGNAAALQVSISARNLQNINETYDTQKELIKKQKEMATRVDENSDEMREISAKCTVLPTTRSSNRAPTAISTSQCCMAILAS